MTTLTACRNCDDHGRGNRFETNCADLISVLASVDKPRMREDFGETLSDINSTLSGTAWCFLSTVPHLALRLELTRDAVQIWHHNMLAKGFRSYLLRGNGRPFAPFAFRSLRNICVSLTRQLNRASPAASLDYLPDRRNDVGKSTERRELQQDCHELLKSLSPRQRECLRLIYWEGLSVDQTAERMGVNSRTVATWHFRGRQQLAPKFRRRGYRP
jgi:RNA polymerase sigma factor (sigma-70 family)